MKPQTAISPIIKSKSDIITPDQVATEYQIPITTQRVWKCTNRYG